jgi:hypothetical protein
VTIVEDCDRDAFRKRVAVQVVNFEKAHPDSKAFIDQIQATPA